MTKHDKLLTKVLKANLKLQKRLEEFIEESSMTNSEERYYREWLENVLNRFAMMEP